MITNQSKKILNLASDALYDLKAHNIVVLEVGSFTSVTDYMLIASGTSKQHVRSIAENVEKVAKKNKVSILGVEGETTAEWMLIDLGDVIVHIMTPEVRNYYQLEKLWSVEDIADSTA